MSQTASDKPDFYPELSAALERFIDGLRQWQEQLFHGDDWYERARLRLLQIRSELRGSAGPAFDAAREGTGDPLLIGVLAQINSITFVAALANPASGGDEFEDDVEDVARTERITPCLDLFIDKFDRLHQDYADTMSDPSDWEPYCQRVIEDAGEIVGIVLRLFQRCQGPADPSSARENLKSKQQQQPKMSPELAQTKAETYVTMYGFPGINKLMNDIGCGKSTILKAITASEIIRNEMAKAYLVRRSNKPKQPPEHVSQAMFVDNLIRILIESSEENEERARFNSPSFRSDLMTKTPAELSNALAVLRTGDEVREWQKSSRKPNPIRDRSRPQDDADSGKKAD